MVNTTILEQERRDEVKSRLAKAQNQPSTEDIVTTLLEQTEDRG